MLIIGYDSLREEIYSAMRSGNINNKTIKSHFHYTGLDINKPVRDNFIDCLATVFDHEKKWDSSYCLKNKVEQIKNSFAHSLIFRTTCN